MPYHPDTCPHFALARAEKAEAKVAALEAGMRGLVERMRTDAHNLEGGVQQANMCRDPTEAKRVASVVMEIKRCADELSALLNRPADGGE